MATSSEISVFLSLLKSAFHLLEMLTEWKVRCSNLYSLFSLVDFIDNLQFELQHVGFSLGHHY